MFKTHWLHLHCTIGLAHLAILLTSHAGFARHCCIDRSPRREIQECCKVDDDWNSTQDCCVDNGNDTVKKIHLAALVPMLHNDAFGFKQVMLMAMDIINNRSDILPGYEVVMHFGDTVHGSPSKAISCLFKWLNKDPIIHMIIGPAFTNALQPVVAAISQWNLLGLAYASMSHQFNSYIYRNMYRMVPNTYSFNLAKIAFLKKFNWARVAIIHAYDDTVFSPTVRHLQKQLDKNNISTIALEGFQIFDNVDLKFQIAKFKALDARIIIGEFNDRGARYVFCEAYKQKLYGPKYVWIVFSLLSPDIILKLPKKEYRKISCSREQIKEVIQGMFAMGSVRLRSDNVTTFSGLTAHEYMEILNKKSSVSQKRKKFSTYAFDSVFMAARALEKSSRTGTPPENFTYTSRSHLKALKKILEFEKFEGISGPIRFDSQRERLGTVYIAQIRNETWTDIGQHFTFDNRLEIDDASTIWPGGRPPKDRMVRREKLLTNDITLIVVIWLLAIIGILLSLAFLYFNVAYRDNRLIKMSSPQLNNLIILGCLLCYVSTILYGLDAQFLSFQAYGTNCNVRTAVMSIGFSLAFGAMFSKTWRVHKIFTAAKTLKKMAIKDIHLFGIVAVLVILDIFYLSLWFGYDPMTANKLNFESQEETIDDASYVPVLFQCTCEYKTYFIAAMYAYKGILLLFGLFLAWETRNVTIPALNDSKFIGMSVYNVVTLSLIGAIVTTALDNTIHYEAPYAISSLCLIICTTATLLLVFVPKVYGFILGSDDQTFNTSTINNGVSSIGRTGNGSHAFRFDSDSGKFRHFSTKSVQTNHHELIGSAGMENGNVNTIKSNLNQGFEVSMDDIELDENDITIPETRYDHQVTDSGGLVTFMLTDM